LAPRNPPSQPGNYVPPNPSFTTGELRSPKPLLHKPIRSHVTNQSHRIPSHPIASHRTQHSSIHSLISSHMQTHSFLFFILTTHQLREIHNNIQFNHNQFLRNSSSNEDRLIIHLHVFSHTTYDMLRSVTRHTTCCVQSHDTRHVAFSHATHDMLRSNREQHAHNNMHPSYTCMHLVTTFFILSTFHLREI